MMHHCANDARHAGHGDASEKSRSATLMPRKHRSKKVERYDPF